MHRNARSINLKWRRIIEAESEQKRDSSPIRTNGKRKRPRSINEVQNLRSTRKRQRLSRSSRSDDDEEIEILDQVAASTKYSNRYGSYRNESSVVESKVECTEAEECLQWLIDSG